MSKYLDSDGVLYLWQKLKALFAGKVDTETGKGLSTNDYTTDEKTKLAGIDASANNYTLPTASATVLGGIKVGENLSIDGNGVLSAQDSYELPKATTSVLGGVKVGANLAVDSNGTLSGTYSVASSSANGLMSSADKTKLDAFGAADTYALKTDLSNVYTYKGSVAAVAGLPSGVTVGDVYNVEATGMNYAWTGTEWDALGEILSIESISNSDIDTILSA